MSPDWADQAADFWAGTARLSGEYAERFRAVLARELMNRYGSLSFSAYEVISPSHEILCCAWEGSGFMGEPVFNPRAAMWIAEAEIYVRIGYEECTGAVSLFTEWPSTLNRPRGAPYVPELRPHISRADSA